ncbi:MAG: AI-2E family transporter [Acidobacteriaceae bacterium]|nr:AI-2E family transporter [Acidobacteriaceae bacterium]
MALFTPLETAHGSLRAGTSLIATAAAVALLYYGRDFFETLIVSALLAFILDPAVLLVMKLRLPRPAATGIVIGVAIVATYLLGMMAWSQLSTIAEDLPAYTARLNDLWAKANDRMDQFEKRSVDLLVPKTLRDQSQQIQQKPQEALKSRRRRVNTPAPAPAAPVVQEVRIHTEPKPLLRTIYVYASGYFHVFVMASFVPFLVYFMLSWRDHLNKSVARLFQGEQRYIVSKTWSGIGDSTRAYVLGNFLLWVFLGSLSAIAFFFLGVPYWAVIGPLSGLLSLAPYVGLPLSIVPPLLAVIAIPTTLKVVITIVVVTAALHFLAMNVLYAKVIGKRVRLNPLVVTVALMFWGILWGGIGLILAVPITAAIKTLCDNVESLEPYGKLLGD